MTRWERLSLVRPAAAPAPARPAWQPTAHVAARQRRDESHTAAARSFPPRRRRWTARTANETRHIPSFAIISRSRNHRPCRPRSGADKTSAKLTTNLSSTGRHGRASHAVLCCPAAMLPRPATAGAVLATEGRLCRAAVPTATPLPGSRLEMNPCEATNQSQSKRQRINATAPRACPSASFDTLAGGGPALSCKHELSGFGHNDKTRMAPSLPNLALSVLCFPAQRFCPTSCPRPSTSLFIRGLSATALSSLRPPSTRSSETALGFPKEDCSVAHHSISAGTAASSHAFASPSLPRAWCPEFHWFCIVLLPRIQ